MPGQPAGAGNRPDIVSLFRNVDQSDPRRPFAETEYRTLSYGEIGSQLRPLTGLFRSAGLSAGDRVVLSTVDDASLIVIFFAMLRNGLTAVVLNPQARATELARLIDAADPAALFIDAEIAQRVLPEQLERQPVFTIRPHAERATSRSSFWRRADKSGDAKSYPGLLKEIPAAEPPAAIDDDAVAYILFTSGTTSRPKGVEITHRSLFAQMHTFVTHYGLDDSTRLMNLLPLHHTDGLTQGATVTACANATLLRPMQIKVNRIGEILDACHDEKATHLVAVPSMLTLMVGLGDQYHDVFRSPWFRFVISTAAFLDEGTWQRFEKLFGAQVVNVYGLTETVCETMYCGPDDATRRVGTIGRPVDSEARIIDDEGNILPPGSEGELQVRGDHIMRGYFRMPAETAEVLSDGWLSTGDLAVADPDGFYRIVGRKKDVIISAGMNVYPEDVNAVLRTVPGISDAATVSMPDEQWGERVVAAVTLQPGATLTEADVAEHFLKNASPEKLPREIHFLHEFPRGPAGKVVKAELRRMIESARAASHASSGGGSTEERVMRCAEMAFKCRPGGLSLDSTSSDVDGWTSLAHVEFLLSLESEFSISLTPEDIMRINSVGDAANLVEERIG